MNIFSPKGFDTIIGKGTSVTGSLALTGTVIIDGTFIGDKICNALNGGSKTTLMVNGAVTVDELVLADDLTVTVSVSAKTINVEGTLAIKAGSKVTATTIYYRTLVIEPGAVIIGEMKHLDHCSEGEQT